MTIKEAIRLLQIEYDMCPVFGVHYKKGVDALKKQLEVDLTEVYPYNLALDIFGDSTPVAKEKALALSVEGIEIGIRTLTNREIDILKLRYKKKLTYEQIAKTQEVTRERIRQIQMKALRKLRHPQRLAKMKAYSYHYVVERMEDYDAIFHENKELKKVVRFYMGNKATAAETGTLLKTIDLMEKELHDLGFSVRTYNCLARTGVRNLRGITEMTIEELEKVRNLGRKSRDEVLRKLDEYGLKLKGDEHEREV